MSNVYTTKDWIRDGELNPQLFQEVEHSIYTGMFNALPPYKLESATQQILENQLGVKFTDTFCIGEAYGMDDEDEDNELYMAFGKTTDGKCYYLGLRRAE